MLSVLTWTYHVDMQPGTSVEENRTGQSAGVARNRPVASLDSMCYLI